MIFNKKNSLLLLWITPIAAWAILYWLWGFDGLYGQDSYEYLRYSKAINNFFLTGENPGDYFWPLYYPIIGGILALLLQSSSFSLLIVSVLSLSISAFYIYKLILLLHPRKRNFSVLYVVGLYIFSPYVLKNGMVVMSDLLATCFIVLCIYNFYNFKLKSSISSFYGIAIFGTLAIMTRYASFVVLFPFAILASLHFFKFKKRIKHIPILVLVVAFLVIPHFLVRLSNYDSFLSHQWLQDWSVSNFFKSNFTTIDGTSQYLYPNLIYSFSNAFHPGYLFLGLPFIIFFIINPKLINFSWPMLLSIALYALFIAGIPFQNTRFLLLTYPLVLIGFFPVFNYLTEKFTGKQFYLGISLIILVQSILIVKAFNPIIERNRLEIEISELMEPFQNETLYSFDIDIALKGRGLNFDYHNMWEKKHTQYKNGDLVLFHPTKFEKQWKDKNPMLNWDYLNSNFKLKTILDCPMGWKLYQVETN